MLNTVNLVTELMLLIRNLNCYYGPLFEWDIWKPSDQRNLGYRHLVISLIGPLLSPRSFPGAREDIAVVLAMVQLTVSPSRSDNASFCGE